VGIAVGIAVGIVAGLDAGKRTFTLAVITAPLPKGLEQPMSRMLAQKIPQKRAVFARRFRIVWR
jgi:hypothetical protein